MKAIFICKVCGTKKEYTGVNFITRHVAGDGWVINFIEYTKWNIYLKDTEYTLDGVDLT